MRLRTALLAYLVNVFCLSDNRLVLPKCCRLYHPPSWTVSSWFSSSTLLLPLEELKSPVSDAELVADVLKDAPSLRATFLASLGCRIHASAVRVLFSTLVLQDDARLFGLGGYPARSAVAPLLSNSKKYAHAVKSVVVRDPDFLQVGVCATQTNGGLSPISREGALPANAPGACQPLDANDISRILELCSNLEGLAWESSFPPPDGLCEVSLSCFISSRLPQCFHGRC